MRITHRYNKRFRSFSRHAKILNCRAAKLERCAEKGKNIKSCKNIRIGIGYDIHKLVPGRELVLGGVTVPFEKGLIGHSDADVLIHAVCDSLLGASGSGDIGERFPDTSSEYKDIFSIELLEKTYKIIKEKNFEIINIDATIFAQSPKLTPFKKEMEENIACAVNISPADVNIKASTTDALGVIGKGEGIAAMCAALICSCKNSHNFFLNFPSMR